MLDHAAANHYAVPGALGSLETGLAGEEDGSGASGQLQRSALLTDPEQARDFVVRRFLKEATVAARTLCRGRFEAFGCAGMGSQIQPIPLERMAVRYVGAAAPL